MKVRVGKFNGGSWTSTHDHPVDLDVCSVVNVTVAGAFRCTLPAASWHKTSVLDPGGSMGPLYVQRCRMHAPRPDDAMTVVTRDEAAAAAVMES